MNRFNVPAGAGRAAQKEATGRQVLAAARAEFEDKGYDAASVRGIAARAGVAAGTVIHHYGEKRDLLHAALFEDLEEALGRALARLDPVEDLEEQLRQLARAVFAYYERRPTLARTLLKESLFANPPWAARFAAQVTRVHGAIAALAQAAMRRRALRADVDPALLGVAWFAEQAKLFDLPTRMARSDLHVVKPHQKVLELPGSGGQLAHRLVSTRPSSRGSVKDERRRRPRPPTASSSSYSSCLSSTSRASRSRRGWNATAPTRAAKRRPTSAFAPISGCVSHAPSMSRIVRALCIGCSARTSCSSRTSRSPPKSA